MLIEKGSRAMTQEKKRPKGSDNLSIQAVELCPGLVIDTKIRMGAVWYLEDKYDKPIGELKFDSGRIKDLAYIIVALATQHNPDLTEAEAFRLFKQLTPDEVEQAGKVIEKAFEAKVKNSQGAGQLLENQKQ